VSPKQKRSLPDATIDPVDEHESTAIEEGVAVELSLDDNQRQLLQEILNAAVNDLSPEIADTDNAAYRRTLIERRDALRTLLDAVGGPPA
jgi:hypothetical protein